MLLIYTFFERKEFCLRADDIVNSILRNDVFTFHPVEGVLSFYEKLVLGLNLQSYALKRSVGGLMIKHRLRHIATYTVFYFFLRYYFFAALHLVKFIIGESLEIGDIG